MTLLDIGPLMPLDASARLEHTQGGLRMANQTTRPLVTPEEMLVLIKQQLAARGVEFGDKTEPAEVLRAALDFIQDQPMDVRAKPMSMSRTYGVTRTQLIANSAVEWKEDPTVQGVTSLETYVASCLREHGWSGELTEAETERVRAVSYSRT